MAVTDVSAQVRAWALAEAEAQCFGEDFGVDVTWVAGPAPQGGLMVLYQLLITCKSPLLGQGPLMSVTPIPSPAPTAEQVKKAVTESVRQLRQLSRQLLDGAREAVQTADRAGRAALKGAGRR